MASTSTIIHRFQASWAVLVICLSASLAFAAPGVQTPEGKQLQQSPNPVRIAEGRQALIPIVVSPDASQDLHGTATELANFLEQITGATFAIEQSDTPHGITLGTLEQFPDSGLTESLAIKGYYDGVEAFAIRSDNGHIRLLANNDLGARHAAFRFLELLGCRWFFMTPQWEIIPQSATLSFDLNEDSRPDILTRRIWFSRLAQRGEPGDTPVRDLYEQWSHRNRMAGSLNVRILHTWHAIPNGFKEEFEANPEYFALVDGERQGPQFCVTNESLQQVILTYAKKHLDDNPTSHMVSLDPADRAGWCTCDDCAALGHHSVQPFHLANIVARQLQESHPGKYVGLLAYSWYSNPPDFMLEPNVYVQLTRGMNATQHNFDELFEMWTEKSENLGIYEYYSYWHMDNNMLPGNWVTDLHSNAERLRRYVNHGVNSISAESSNSWGIHGLAYYIANRLMWDSSADVEALRNDFLDKAFGPAAPAISRYYTRMNAGNNPRPGMSLLCQAVEDLEEATKLAAGQPDILARIDDLKKIVIYSYLGERVTAAPHLEQQQATADAKANEEKVRTLEWFTWAYRIRQSHMISWIDFRSAVGRPASEKFDEPTWFWRNTGDNPEQNPWRDDTPVTGEELDERLQVIKEGIGDVPALPEVASSSDYVIVDGGQAAEPDRQALYSALGTFLLASINGEPIRIAIEQRDWAIERPDAQYTLTDLDGKEIASGEVPVGTQSLALEVPEAGVYHFSCFSRGAGFQLHVPADTPGALLHEPGQRYRQGGYFRPVYFYVPKGMKEVIVYAHECGTARINDSQGRVVHEAIADGRIVSIPVPEGEDGKVWSVGGPPSAPLMRLRRFELLNLSNALSFNQGTLFVPRDVAESDGLPILSP